MAEQKPMTDLERVFRDVIETTPTPLERAFRDIIEANPSTQVELTAEDYLAAWQRLEEAGAIAIPEEPPE